MPLDPRPYQTQAIDEARAHIVGGRRRVLIVAPTGSGKTVVGTWIIDSALRREKRVLWLAHRKELIDQTAEHLDENGIPHGVIKARVKPHYHRPVQVASVQTIVRRPGRCRADLVIVDEAHHVASKTYQRILQEFPDAVVLGLTATPYRTDGRGLGNHFQTLVETTSVASLIADGHLVQPIYYSHAAPDLSGVSKRGGDYQARGLVMRCDRPTLIGDIVGTWKRLAGGRRTVAFACSVEHSRHIVQAFNSAGIPAAHIDAQTAEQEREDTLTMLRFGLLSVVSNCGILTEGWDMPAVSAAIIARPTASRGLHCQMIGRTLRPATGKDDCLILDHAGNVMRHGMIEHQPPNILTTERLTDHQPTVSIRVCPSCFAATAGRDQRCPYCDEPFPAPKPRKPPRQVAGELKRTERRGPYLPDAPFEAQAKRLAELLWKQRAAGYKRTWHGIQFRLFFGTWPTKRHYEQARRYSHDLQYHGERAL